jgi:HAD superfamily hydrolase (TIGR01509 family)
MSFPFEAILFDCDGVLVDSEPITLRVMTASLNAVGLHLSYEQTLARFLGKSLPEEIPAIEAEIGKKLPTDFIARFRQDRNVALEREIVAVPGIHELLANLTSQKIPFAVASGADCAKMQITLGKTGLLPSFERAMVGSDMVAHTKPAPDVYLKAAQILGVDPTRCLVIDDTPTGTRAGVAAGAVVMGYCAFTAPQLLLDAGASAVFADMVMLPKLLGLTLTAQSAGAD